MELKKEMTAVSSLKVTENETAEKVGSGDMPVLATPVMAALMENAAAKCVAPLLPEGSTTVGISLNIEHSAATPVGMEVRAEAKLISEEGRKFTFEVTAWDERGEIGKGTHERVAVCRTRFLEKAQNK